MDQDGLMSQTVLGSNHWKSMTKLVPHSLHRPRLANLLEFHHMSRFSASWAGLVTTTLHRSLRTATKQGPEAGLGS